MSVAAVEWISNYTTRRDEQDNCEMEVDWGHCDETLLTANSCYMRWFGDQQHFSRESDVCANLAEITKIWGDWDPFSSGSQLWRCYQTWTEYSTRSRADCSVWRQHTELVNLHLSAVCSCCPSSWFIIIMWGFFDPQSSNGGDLEV